MQQVLNPYKDYYNENRCLLGLGKDTPEQRKIETEEKGANIVAIPQVGGLHHRYTRKAA